jgi:hypothetical protein
VETRAAAFLRMNPGVRKAVLYIDYPMGTCGTYRSTLPDMLPEGAQLWVISPRQDGNSRNFLTELGRESAVDPGGPAADSCFPVYQGSDSSVV